jgi:hypothetical protein
MIVPAPAAFWSRIHFVPPAHATARTPGAPVVTHRFTMQLRQGCSEQVMHPNRGVEVRCKRGRLWITHDGDPKDLVLEPDESYTAERGARMTLHALQPCEMEMQFSS